ncbi:hypothetical protein CEXT_443771 [Caerostris extrusa]|uniref:Uncharacterized protein n=1 Tax=Caerostris extrusa TaxID=172846 RepID=A0AAV4XWK7_CAEEX|nr:hypothetical protein CEXT_443771 [Caerostris extrusa]
MCLDLYEGEGIFEAVGQNKKQLLLLDQATQTPISKPPSPSWEVQRIDAKFMKADGWGRNSTSLCTQKYKLALTFEEIAALRATEILSHFL